MGDVSESARENSVVDRNGLDSRCRNQNGESLIMATTHTPDIVTPVTGDLQKHPPGLYVLFATEMWERFSFYSMLALFTLYLQNGEEGFGWPRNDATRLYSYYLALVYFSPLIGGWIADRALG